jgi:hypothetical protein
LFVGVLKFSSSAFIAIDVAKKCLRSMPLNFGGDSNSASSKLLKIFIFAMKIPLISYSENDGFYDKNS